MIALRDVNYTSYIPEPYYKDITSLVVDLYQSVSFERIPCLEEDVLRMLRAHFLAVCHYYKHQETVPFNWYEDNELWMKLNQEFSELSHIKEYAMFRMAIKQILDIHRFFYEENWIFSKVLNEEPAVKYHHTPTKSIW